MLEAIRERSQGWIAKVILLLLIVPFALWGVDSYISGGGKEPPVASVGDVEISQREFGKALKEQQEQMDAKVEEKALRKLVIEQLVNSSVLTQFANKAGFTVLDPQIQSVLTGVDVFQENGKFSEQRMDAWLAGRGMSRGELMALIGKDLLLKQVQISYGEGAVAPKPSTNRLAKLLAQQREVNEAIFDQKNYSASVSIDDKAVEAEYKANQARYATPAMVRVQYLTLSQDALAAAVQISDAQVRKYFDENQAQFQEPEQRRASHILIKLDTSADAAAKEFGLVIEDSGWIGQGNAQPPMLGDARLMNALLSEDSLKKKQNVEAVEVAPNTLVSARVIEHRPAGARPLADVAAEIRTRLTLAAARKLAVEAGNKALKERLVDEQLATVPTTLSAAMSVSRMQPLNIPAASLRAIFSAKSSKLPVWVGAETAEGYRLYRINRVMDSQFPEEQLKAMSSDLRRMLALEEMRAYMESAKARTKINIQATALDPKAE